MTTMPTANRISQNLRTDLLLAAFLIALVAVARLTPHAWNFAPVIAAGLFAGATLGTRSLAFAVPIGGMLLSDIVLGSDHWGIKAFVYASLAASPLIGMFARRFRVSVMLVPAVLSGSLIFFAASNFAVWLFSGMYSLDWAGLAACYVAALPFFQYTLAGETFWSVALFGGAWLVQRATARRAPDALAHS
ncbi:MAG: hypothetical protein FJX62_01310 [Alphaproteobacteria bacterium]|nr:hypothetical protein [Alphaproteobacteria bacterium]